MNNNPFVGFVDHLGYRPILFINRHERDSSFIGACMTIVVAGLIFAIFLFYFVEFVMGSNMTVLSSKDNLSEPIKLDLSNKLFMFRFVDSFGNKVDPRIADLHASLWNYEKAQFEYEFLEMEDCQYGRHFQREDYERHLDHININNYLCLHPDSNMTLSYDRDSSQSSHILITIAKCTNTTKAGEPCFDLDDIQNKLDRESYYFSYSIVNTRIDHYDFTSPLQNINFNNNIIVTTTVSYDYSMYYKFINYRSDKGWLVNEWDNKIGFQFDESLTEKIIHTEDPSYIYENAFGSYKFRLSPSSTNNYERTFPKFPTVIGNISACSKAILLLGKLFVRFFSTAYYYVDLITLLQSKMLVKKQSIKEVTQLKKAQTQTKIHTRRGINLNEKIAIDPWVSSMWMILPNITKKTKQVELCKQKVGELLSVDNLIKNMFSCETITSNLFDKKNEPTNTSSSAMNSKTIPQILTVTENKPCLLRPIAFGPLQLHQQDIEHII